MDAALELVGSSIGNVTVSKSSLDARGGAEWLVTFATAIGDVPTLESVSSLTGTGAKIDITEVVQGNAIGGEFTLELGGEYTSTMPHDVSAIQLLAELEELSGTGMITTGRSGPDTEDGYVWDETFLSAPGDVPMLAADPTSLTGIGASMLVREIVKGQESSGEHVKVGFEAPAHCSRSQVKLGVCGDPVVRYDIEYDSSSSFGTADRKQISLGSEHLLTQVQRVITQSEGAPASGTYTISYDGRESGPIEASADAVAVRDALEALPGVRACRVDRDYSSVRLVERSAVARDDAFVGVVIGLKRRV